jgi:hypothetical protein
VLFISPFGERERKIEANAGSDIKRICEKLMLVFLLKLSVKRTNRRGINVAEAYSALAYSSDLYIS